MTDHTGNTQPIKTNLGNTQPLKPVKKRSRWLSIFGGILAFVVLIGAGGFGGYGAGLADRQAVEDGIVSQQLNEQYQFALVDIEFGRYDAARQRLEFILSKNPNYPGATQKLAEVFTLSTIPTATATVTLTPTPDFSGAESAFQRAQQLIMAQDWPNALAALDTVRKNDPTYKAAQVDGMYYFALRNYGHVLILQQGNLEGGIYYLTLAERFGTLDNTSVQLRESARLYITGASFWELDWGQAVLYFSQLNGSSLYDGTMTAAQRFSIASMRYGDELYERQDFCGATEQYANAGTLQGVSIEYAADAYNQCFPPEPVATEPPVVPTP